jgi:hypothetical protein
MLITPTVLNEIVPAQAWGISGVLAVPQGWSGAKPVPLDKAT